MDRLRNAVKIQISWTFTKEPAIEKFQLAPELARQTFFTENKLEGATPAPTPAPTPTPAEAPSSELDEAPPSFPPVPAHGTGFDHPAPASAPALASGGDWTLPEQVACRTKADRIAQTIWMYLCACWPARWTRGQICQANGPPRTTIFDELQRLKLWGLASVTKEKRTTRGCPHILFVACYPELGNGAHPHAIKTFRGYLFYTSLLRDKHRTPNGEDT